MATVTRATLDDLLRTPAKAELINGRIVELMTTGVRPNEIAGNIYVSLRAYAKLTGRGRAFTDNIGFGVPRLPSGRESFSPDASYYDGTLPADLMQLIRGAPTFAVEVRSQSDYGPAAEAAMEEKRDEYFVVGTPVVWDVDPIAETIAVYRPGFPVKVFQASDIADAEPAVPGWRIAVAEVFA